MANRTYTKYRAGGFMSSRPIRTRQLASQQAGAVNAAPGAFNGAKTARKRFTAARAVKWAATLVMVGALALILYVGGVFGYGYLQARAGQAQLRSLFSITSGGSLDPQSLRNQAEAMAAGLNRLDPVGEIDIEGIDSQWMIVEGADDEALKKGPGHIESTALPGAGGNFSVAGDRVLYGAPFLHLDDVQEGDRIKVKMPYATFTYRVRETFIVTPDDTSVLEPVGYEAITLLTCDPPWDIKQRIVVRGELEQVEPAGTEF